ncbi:MAG: pseudouridine-5'-phosphate glycosidase [Blastocatellia bacterium]
MGKTARNDLRVAERVSRALALRGPVVALESTVIAHGLPAPLNLETALACQEAAEREGATAATIGIVDGVITIGLSDDELKAFAAKGAGEARRVEKVGLNNLAGVMLRGGPGTTTVAASLRLASLAGLQVFSTGGIGGVHRGASDSFDISADLTALSRLPLVCVCAGAKAILDLPKTLEQLETLGVPVIGYRTGEFPAFYSRASGLPVDIRVETPDEAAEFAALHWRTGGQTGVLVCVPVPEEFDMPASEVERATDQATRAAAEQGIRGKALTPFLLSQMERLTGGKTLSANRALLINNARVAAQVAASLSRLAR